MSTRGINRATIMGNLASEPELRYAANGSAVVNVSVATNEAWKDADGKPQERAEFHRLVAFGKTGEVIAKYLHKGDPGFFEGQLQTRKWQDKDGHDRWSTEIVVKDFQFVGGKGERSAPPAPTPQPTTGGGDDFDSIPFAPIDWRAS